MTERGVQMLRRLAIVLSAIVLLAVPASAFGSPGWVAGRSFPLPAEALAGTGEVRYQSGGTATEAFVHLSSLTPPYVTAVHVGIVPPGGAYQDQMVIDSTLGSFPLSVSIAVAPDGAAVAVWTEALGSVSGPDAYRAAYRPAGSDTWEAPFTIATDEEAPPTNEVGNTKLEPVIAADGAAAVGVDHLASKETGGGGQKLQRIDVAVHPAGGSWSVQRISPAGESAEGLSLATDSAGDLTAVYQQRYLETGKFEEGKDRYHVVSRRLPASSGIWAPAEELTTGSTTDADGVHLGENENGDAVIAWQLDNYVAKTLNTEVVTRRGAEGSWTAAAQAVTGGSGSVPIAAAVAPNEDAYVLYRYSGNSSAEDCIGVVHAFVTGIYFKPTCVSPLEEGSSSGSIAFREDDAYMGWTAFTPGEPAKKQTVQAAIWRAGAETPGAPTNLDVPGRSYGPIAIVPDDEGSVVAFYSLAGGESGEELRAAAYDASPPILIGSDIPTTATAGVPVTFDSSFADLWSELAAGQPTWSFGDGSAPVAGSSVTHTFAKPGTYTITLAASDPLGNASSSSHTIVVASPPSRPEITLNRPTCKKGLSKAACKRYRSSPAAWRTLSGGVTDASSVITRAQIAVYRSRRKHTESLHGGRFHKSTIKQAAKTFVPLTIEQGRWSLRLPKLLSGSYTIDVRAVDAAGAEAELLAKVTVR